MPRCSQSEDFDYGRLQPYTRSIKSQDESQSWLDGPVFAVSTLENTLYCLLIAVSNNLKYGVKTTAAVSTLVSDLEIYLVYLECTVVKFR